jgi:Tfp pilus assembly protein PilF
MRCAITQCRPVRLRSIVKMSATVLLLTWGIFLGPLTATAAPYRPSDSNTVLLQLDPATQKAASNMSTRIAQSRTNASIAEQTAATFIKLGRLEHDERYFGYAAGVLESWRTVNAAPIELIVLRADVAQHQHRFIEAKQILDEVLTRDSRNIRARLMRASVLMTIGQPLEAKADCQKLIAAREVFLATVCLAQASSLLGQLPSSYALLSNALSQSNQLAPSPGDASEQLAWSYGVAAEMAQRLGDASASEAWLRKALALSPSDLVSRLQLCDLLIQNRHAAEVPQLLANISPSEPILLRLALAAKQIGQSEDANSALQAWRMAVEQSDRLGVRLHLRELAIGQLQLLRSSADALATAKKNWEVQREPIDARVLAAAARAQNDHATLRMLAEWRQSLHLQDAGLGL